MIQPLVLLMQWMDKDNLEEVEDILLKEEEEEIPEFAAFAIELIIQLKLVTRSMDILQIGEEEEEILLLMLTLLKVKKLSSREMLPLGKMMKVE